jgi:hypothetical protein
MVISPNTKRYSVFVTPPGQAEVALATNYAFRSEQAATSSLNNWGMTAESGSVTVCNMGIGTTAGPPVITTQPASRTVVAGQTATFSVAAAGTAPLSYQWRRNGANIGGASASSYTTPPTTSSDHGAQFSVLVSNAAGSATSASATLTVSAATRLLTANPSTLSFGDIGIGSSSLLSSTVTNTGNSTVTISGLSVTGPGLSVSGVSSGQVLAPGQSASLQVRLAPFALGSVTGSVAVTSNASNSPTTVSLLGRAVTLVSRATLTWQASTSSVVGYHVYSGTVPGGPYTRRTSSPVAGLSYVDSSVLSGRTYYYVVTAVNDRDVESPYSNQATAVVP